MHIPSSFKVEHVSNLLQIMAENAFATIITTDENNLPVATSLPFLVRQNNDEIILQAHFAKANPQWKHLEKNTQILVIFQGPHCYVSPSWYKSPGVPTWDYITVHAYGTAKLFHNNDQLQELIETLSDKYESTQEKPWKAENNYPDKMLNAIVGFEICVQEMKGKVKIGQNKSEEDLRGVIDGLKNSSDKPHQEYNLAIAKLIKKHLKTKE